MLYSDALFFWLSLVIHCPWLYALALIGDATAHLIVKEPKPRAITITFPADNFYVQSLELVSKLSIT
jgi:hypothetical protein